MAAAGQQRELPEDYKTWIVVYPVYINKERSLKQGRRIKKDNAIKNPVFPELLEGMRVTGLQIIGEPHKIHPREPSVERQFWGRIRVQLRTIEGDIINEKFQTRDDVYQHLAKVIPSLEMRTKPQKAPEEAKSKKAGKGKKK